MSTSASPLHQLRRDLSRVLLTLRMKSPFFATLAQFAPVSLSRKIPVCNTDGDRVFVNPEAFAALTPAEQRGVFMHVVMHAALFHPTRRGARDEKRWNAAADIVVNGMLVRAGLDLPPDPLRDEAREELRVEEIYELIEAQDENPEVDQDIADEPPPDAQPLDHGLPEQGDDGPGEQEGEEGEGERKQEGDPQGAHNPFDTAKRAAAEARWREAMERAMTMSMQAGRGDNPEGATRDLAAALRPGLDWRTLLWRFLTRTPTDYAGFDRRFVGRGLYLDALDSESVHVWVAIDTSGSVNQDNLDQFLGELDGILGSYPHLTCSLYYADAQVYGPYSLSAYGERPPAPQGGGGTDFRPFFAAVEKDANTTDANVCVYLTDGDGSFPERAPDIPTLWIRTPGGIPEDMFPFGEVTLLVG